LADVRAAASAAGEVGFAERGLALDFQEKPHLQCDRLNIACRRLLDKQRIGTA